MASVQDLEQPLVVSPRPADSVRDKLAHRFAKRVLKFRFHEHEYETLGIDETAKEVAWPLVYLGVLILSMVISTGVAFYHLESMGRGLAPSCVALESQTYSPETSPGLKQALTINTRSDWNQDHMQPIFEAVNNQDVHYEYSLFTVTDFRGRGFQIDTLPWNVNVSHLEFPLFLTLKEENAINISNIIRDNNIVQTMNPLWLVLSVFSLWGWKILPVLGPSAHVLQLGSASLVVNSAACALVSPPEVHPTMSRQQLLNYNRCKGSDQGLVSLTWILIFQTIVACLLLPVSMAVSTHFYRLTRLSERFCGIRVSKPSEDLSFSICPICLDPFGGDALDSQDPGQDSQDPGQMWTLPCSHYFHRDCVLPWLIRGKESTSTCPICRAS